MIRGKTPLAKFPALAALVAIPLFLSCFTRDNPLDTHREGYAEMKLFSPANNAVYQTDSIHVTWEFSGRLHFKYQLDGGDWQILGNLDHPEFGIGNLDEGGHTLILIGESSTGWLDTVSTQFSVDAVPGPSLLIYPRSAHPGADSIVQLQVWAEEVNAIVGVHAFLVFDPTRLHYETGGSTWNNARINLRGLDTLEVSAGTLDSVSGFRGSGPVATLTFWMMATPAILAFIPSRTSLTDVNGHNVPLYSLRNGTVE